MAAANTANESSQHNVVKGRVEIKGTRTGVPGLIVRIYDVDGPRDPAGPQVRRTLASTSTDQGTAGDAGSFTVRYSDDLVLKGRPDGGRPNLLVSISPPETRRNGNVTVPIFETEVRPSAGREECFLVHVELEDLKQHRVALPRVVDATVGDPNAAAIAAELAREHQTQLREAITNVRKKAVTETRIFEEAADKDLRERVLQYLTGLNPEMPQWKRFVPPGMDARRIVKENHKAALTAVINPLAQQGTVTYLVLSAEERAELGSPPDAARIEQLLRQRNTSSLLLRRDPAALACLRRSDQHPFDPRPQPPVPPPPPPDPVPNASVDEKVSQVIQRVQIPESGGTGGRPDHQAVADQVAKLKLAKGPADVPAFYDFHNLQIAFDHVWEDARAAGVLESAKRIYRAVTDAGGDPKVALAADRNPLRGLFSELELVRQAQARFAAPSSSPPPATSHRRKQTETQTDPYSPGNSIPDPGGPGWDKGSFDQVDIWDSGQAVFTTYPLAEGYPFTVFADGSTNFGLLVTYRLRMAPDDYQVGRLVSTKTLAPKESISLTMRRVVKTSFNRKHVQSNQEMRKEEAKETSRDEAEVVLRAQAKTNFALTSEGGYDLGPFGSGSFTTALTKDKESGSQETKKAFREAIRDASQELRSEVKWEHESSETVETEHIEKREISNPNDELALTYIFYELQRRYIASERLHSVRPVILVGQRVPAPEEVNDDWIRRHDWIIKRFLPDDSFLPALDYLATRERGDHIVLAELKSHMESLRATVRDLTEQVLTARSERFARYAAIEDISREKADAENREDFYWNFFNAYRTKVETTPESKDALKILDESAREAYEQAVREERELRARMDREATALQVATDTYIRAQANYTNQRLQIDRLTKYLKSDILRYLHAIWSYEHPDQQFFRHHTILAPRLEAVQRRYALEETSDWPIGVLPQPGKACYRVTFTVEVDDDLDADGKEATLAELADLDHPLGYKGNYIIYPLKESNALTDFMLAPYLDAEFGLRDPDGPGNWTLQEFSNYVQCLRERLGDRFIEVEAELRRQYQELLADPLRDGEEIIIPTNSLYMQMLVDPGKALEEFKEEHRRWDVQKVKAEVLAAQLDNLRRAKMVLAGRWEDPDVEAVKNVYYQGETPPHDGDE